MHRSFMIGCNYWASNAGTEMWKQFDPAVIDADFAALKENGADTLRIFPNWRDFQPVTALAGYQGASVEYRVEDGTPDGGFLADPAGLSPVMVERMRAVCRMAEKHGLSLVLSLVTGWMSGRMFMPDALKGKNLITDPEALRFEHRFVSEMVRQLKGERAIVAWDLGNECNCMGAVSSSHEAYLWTMTIALSIRAQDAQRPIFSGMHSLSVAGEGHWTMADQGELTDVLTPHPYPGSPTIGAHVTPTDSYRTMGLPTAQMELYAAIGGKPAMIEEQGMLDEIFSSHETAALATRVNLASAWANGGLGHLWWCAYDQKNLDFFPYSMSMRELGWLDEKRRPKAVARESARFAKKLAALGSAPLTDRRIDACCVLTNGQAVWPVAAMTYLLGKQAGMQVTFAHQSRPIPAAPVYLLPSVKGWTPLKKETYYELLRRVHDEGATLYVSFDGGCLENFEGVFGLRSQGQYKPTASAQAIFSFPEGERRLNCRAASLALHVSPLHAEILGRSEADAPVFTRAAYGRGQVFFLNFGLEASLWEQPEALEGGSPFAAIYRRVLAASPAEQAVRTENPLVGVTVFRREQARFAVAVNYSNAAQPVRIALAQGMRLEPVLAEDSLDTLPAGEFAVYRIIE